MIQKMEAKAIYFLASRKQIIVKKMKFLHQLK